MSDQTSQATNAQNQAGNSTRGEITPELIKKIADRVYALLMNDLKIESERYRMMTSTNQKGRRDW